MRAMLHGKPGSLCLCVIRQILPGFRFAEPYAAERVAQVIDSMQESDLDL